MKKPTSLLVAICKPSVLNHTIAASDSGSKPCILSRYVQLNEPTDREMVRHFLREFATDIRWAFQALKLAGLTCWLHFERSANTARIIDLITSFLNKDLIPAIILWQNESNLVFVIDGSHRLSALAAWINDDYGDGDITKQLYEGKFQMSKLKSAIKLES